MIDITGAFGCAIRGMCLCGNQLGENIHGIKLYWDKYNGGSGVLSPDYSFIIANAQDCIVKDNTMARSALVENVVLRGDNSSSIIENNIGALATQLTTTGSPLLN